MANCFAYTWNVVEESGVSIEDVLGRQFGKSCEIHWMARPLHKDIWGRVADAAVVAVVLSADGDGLGSFHRSRPACKFNWNSGKVVALTPQTAELFPSLAPPEGIGLDSFGLSDYAR